MRRAKIYGDLVVILNFLVDFLLLLGTNRLAGFPLAVGRSALAAGLGSAYAAGCLVPGFRFLAGNLWRMVSLVGMATVAFGWNRSAVQRGGVFLLLSMALGGIALTISRRDGLCLILASGGIWLLCRLSAGQSAGGREYVPVEIRWGGQQVRLTALRDSGNTLRDPITGEPVMVIGPAAARQLTGLTREDLTSPVQTLANRPLAGLRLIPYRAVGQEQGMLLAMRFPDVTIGRGKRSALVAFAPEGLEGQEFQALTGGSV